MVADECLTASLIIAETSLAGAGIINKIMRLSSEVSLAQNFLFVTEVSTGFKDGILANFRSFFYSMY